MNLPEILKTAVKEAFTQREAINLGKFLQANASKIEFWTVSDWDGDTYIVLKWPHKVPDLTVLP